jgi:hypothetical protein
MWVWLWLWGMVEVTFTLDKTACRGGEPYPAVLGAAPLGVLGYSAYLWNQARKWHLHDESELNGTSYWLCRPAAMAQQHCRKTHSI